MSKKTAYFGFVALMVLAAAVALTGGLDQGQKAQVSVGILPAGDGSAASVKAVSLIRDFGRVPVFFVPNEGLTDDSGGFTVRGTDKTVYFAPEGVTFALNRPARSGSDGGSERWIVKLDFLGARKDVKPEGMEKTGASISYFRGKPEEWKAGLPAYSRIVYRDLWPGIDLAYRGDLDKLKHEFIVHPGADPALIRLAYRGAERVALTAEGHLEVKTPAGSFVDEVPVAYQDLAGERAGVRVAYAVDAPAAGPDGRVHAYGFEVGEYDRSRILVLDPVTFVYCGYIGGLTDEDYGFGIAVDSSGNAYVAGRTQSDATFPVIVGPDLTSNGNREAFVAKVNAAGTGLVYCGYIGGENDDVARAIAVDDSGNAYVTGYTSSTEATFPVTVGPDLTFNGAGSSDAFVARINSSGTALDYCGYIGGDGSDAGGGIAVDDSGNAYVMGYTFSSEVTFPVTVGPDLTYNGDRDVFVAKVDASGTGLVYCGYIGGDAADGSEALYEGARGGIAVDATGHAYIAGDTGSGEATFPVTVGPDLTYNGGGGDAFVAKVDSSGTTLVYCGYIGGSEGDEDGNGIAVDGSGNAYIVGTADSTQATFPVTVGPDLTFNGGAGDIFVTRVNASGTGLVYCGYIGGADQEEGMAIAVDSAGNAYVTGKARSTESSFPVLDGPDLTYNGFSDAFIAKVGSTGTALVYCGYIGAEDGDCGYGIAVDSSRNAYVTGNSFSYGQFLLPVIVGPDLTPNGLEDAFVAKISPSAVDGPPITSLLPSSADAGDPGFILSVVGDDFVDGAVVMWGGSDRPTTYISGSEVQAEIGAADLATGKTVSVTVRNPDGGISNALTFTIDNPLPVLASISPTSVTGGGAGFTLTLSGSGFVSNSVVRWGGGDRTTTYISATELQAAILSADIAVGGEAQVTVFNPAPAGGASTAAVLTVSTYTLASTPTSVTVTAGQSAAYTVSLTPQYGSFDSSVSFSCTGRPDNCTATFSPASVTPGADIVTTTLTLATEASSSSTGAMLLGPTGFAPPALGLLAVILSLFLGLGITKRMPWRLSGRRLAACALICLMILIGGCSTTGGDDELPDDDGTPTGTYQISVKGTSGGMTVSTTVTLVVN
jgi:hypothetical protein